MKNSKILILGGGWISGRLKEYFKAHDFTGKMQSVETLPDFIWNRYDTIINTIANTNIDWCENNKVESYRNNVALAVLLADRAKKNGQKYVFFSSACIFESPVTYQDYESAKQAHYITEGEKPSPQCWYAETKYIAERLIQETYIDSLILRPRLPISAIPHPRNTLNKLLKYPLINDNQESVTVIEDMIPAVEVLLKKKASGIYHMVNEGTISSAELAEAMGHNFKVVSKKEQDERLAEEGRAKRVTCYIGSNYLMLPNIRKRGFEVVNQWKTNQVQESSK